MKELQFTIDITAPRSKVWSALRDDKNLRDWASIIDPETYMVGELKQGNEIQFISAHGGYGVTSLVEKILVPEFLLLRHSADTQNDGQSLREKEWTGGSETYTLTEIDGVTTLTVVFDVPDELETYFKNTYPKAMARIKTLAESNL